MMRSWMMLGARCLDLRDEEGMAALWSVGEVGVEARESSISAVSMWKAWALLESMDLRDLMELIVFRRSKCRLTSIRLLKYISRHSSKVMGRPSGWSSGIATSSNRSFTNLWSSSASSLPVWKMSIFRVSRGNSNFSVMKVNASEVSCCFNSAAVSQPHAASVS